MAVYQVVIKSVALNQFSEVMFQMIDWSRTTRMRTRFWADSALPQAMSSAIASIARCTDRMPAALT